MWKKLLDRDQTLYITLSSKRVHLFGELEENESLIPSLQHPVPDPLFRLQRVASKDVASQKRPFFDTEHRLRKGRESGTILLCIIPTLHRGKINIECIEPYPKGLSTSLLKKSLADTEKTPTY